MKSSEFGGLGREIGRGTLALALLAASLLPSPSRAEDDPAGLGLEDMQLSLWVENDFFAQTDRFYTNGLKLGASVRLEAAYGESSLYNPYTTLGVSLGHSLFTPADTVEPLLLPDDRPYGGYAYVGLAVTRLPSSTGERIAAYRERLRRELRQRVKERIVAEHPELADVAPEKLRDVLPEDELRAAIAGAIYSSDLLQSPPALLALAVELAPGIVGPSAQGERVQNDWHRFLNIATADGWDNQLNDEVALQLYVQIKTLYKLLPDSHSLGEAVEEFGLVSSWGYLPDLDLQGSLNLALGNVFTYAGLSATWRVGYGIGYDLGPQGRIGTPGSATVFRGRSLFALYGYVRGEVRAVAYNMFVDGNLFVASPERPSVNGIVEGHAIERETIVADFEAGAVLRVWLFELGYTFTVRTREFTTQEDLFAFGAFTGSMRFQF